MLPSELAQALRDHLAAEGWQTGTAVPVGAPSVLGLVAARKGGELAVFLPVHGGTRARFKLDADELGDLRAWSERNAARARVAVLFDDGWTFVDVARLPTSWIGRTGTG